MSISLKNLHEEIKDKLEYVSIKLRREATCYRPLSVKLGANHFTSEKWMGDLVWAWIFFLALNSQWFLSWGLCMHDNKKTSSVTTGKNSNWGTHYCAINILYPNLDAKIFQQSADIKSSLCQHREENLARIFFQPTVRVWMFLGLWSCAGIFFLHTCAFRVLFCFKINQRPPLPEVK